MTVVLPQPLPPMMMKISPRLTVKVRSRWMRKSPYAMVMSLTSIAASVSGGVPFCVNARVPVMPRSRRRARVAQINESDQ